MLGTIMITIVHFYNRIKLRLISKGWRQCKLAGPVAAIDGSIITDSRAWRRRASRNLIEYRRMNQEELDDAYLDWAIK